MKVPTSVVMALRSHEPTPVSPTVLPAAAIRELNAGKRLQLALRRTVVHQRNPPERHSREKSRLAGAKSRRSSENIVDQRNFYIQPCIYSGHMKITLKSSLTVKQPSRTLISKMQISPSSEKRPQIYSWPLIQEQKES